MLQDKFAPLNAVLAPYKKKICEPMRAKLEAEGFNLAEKVVKSVHYAEEPPYG